ncbi:MAG: hypothetical protein IJV13_06115 [Prevotella sp.]|nr:hypothetical protein [Prevotella sp.]
MIRRVFLYIFIAFAMGAGAQETANSRQARQMFDRTYQLVFGAQGSMLHYKVNIVGIYKTEGTIWTKGKKSMFEESRYMAWNDGNNYTRVDKKKKTVSYYGANDEDRDKYASKFTFEPNNYTYHIADSEEGYYITLKAKKGVKGIKEARALIDKKTRYPLNVRIKLGIFHTTIQITRFKSGGIGDDVFVFPAAKYKGYEVIHRK